MKIFIYEYIRYLCRGSGSEIKIADAIKLMNDKKLADILILARGGGSIEDLWPFNEELVARSIYESEIPIISAIGHETDYTIADFVADYRAPTPSAAAEIAVQDVREIKIKLRTYNSRFKVALKKKLEFLVLRYEKSMSSRVFTNPMERINTEYVNIDMRVKELEKYIVQKKEEAKLNIQKLIAKLDTLSPLKTLSRGYAIVDVGDKTVKTAKELKLGDMLNLKFADGKREAKVTK